MSDNRWEDVAEVSYAGIQTFIKADEVAPDELTTDDKIAVVGVPFDGAVSRQPGARFGPDAIRETSGVYAYYAGNKGVLTDIDTGRRVDYSELAIKDCGDVPIIPNDIDRSRAQIEGYVEAIAKQAFPVILGGDHYITYPSFLGYTNAKGHDVGVIHLDAHSDTSVSSSIFGEHYHGSLMARINESDHGSYENHALVGIRGHEGADYDDAREQGLQVHTMAAVRKQGIDACIEKAIEHATRGVDDVYLTVDIDVVDPAYAPGTGTPEPGGMNSREVLRAMDLLGECPEIGAMDLVEVAPNLESSISTQRLAVSVVARFLETKFL